MRKREETDNAVNLIFSLSCGQDVYRPDVLSPGVWYGCRVRRSSGPV